MEFFRFSIGKFFKRFKTKNEEVSEDYIYLNWIFQETITEVKGEEGRASLYTHCDSEETMKFKNIHLWLQSQKDILDREIYNDTFTSFS